jgi:hypothetical protein
MEPLDYPSPPSDPPRRPKGRDLIAGGICVVGAGLVGMVSAMFFGVAALANAVGKTYYQHRELYVVGWFALLVAVALLIAGGARLLSSR